jgi:nicotinate-nucleotide adenylyltransferase
MAQKRIGLLGGSFDPIHFGHLILAQQAAEQLDLDKVWFVPASISPLKGRSPIASSKDRLAMIRAAIRGNPQFGVLDVEIRRPGPSFTIDTVESLSGGASDKLFFLIGADALLDLARWKRAEELARRVTFAAFRRPGSRGIRAPRWVRWVEVTGPLIDISSTDIRNRARLGRPVRYFTPDAVAAIVKRRGLYRKP